MPRKTLALISGLVLVTIVLFVIAINNSKTTTPKIIKQQIETTPTPPAHSVLNISPMPVVVAPGRKGAVDVNLNTFDNEVTAVQLEIAYDPNIITNVEVTTGSLFPNPVVLINKNRIKEGRYTYAFGIMPNSPTIKGSGVVATINFTALQKSGEKSQLALLPSSLVTAQGISNSVLKTAIGTIIEIAQPKRTTLE